jgi:hypothetical protein
MTPEFLPKNKNTALAHVMEECAEVIKEGSKIYRFGWASYNPNLPIEERETNRDALLREMEDLELAIERLKGML